VRRPGASALPRNGDAIDSATDHDDLKALGFERSPGWAEQVHWFQTLGLSRAETLHRTCLTFPLKSALILQLAKDDLSAKALITKLT